MQNKLAALITLAAAAHATTLQAGVFSFLKGKAKPQDQAAPSGSDSRTSGRRAEARVDQHGSIMRTGSNTSARVTENGSVSLSKGVVLVSSGDGLMRRPPVQISTPQGEVTVRGSAIVAALPDGSVKMTVLEGHAKGSLGGKDMALDPGQLMIQRHETRDAVKVDLGALTASSALLDGSQYQLPLPAAPQIQSEVVQQVQALGGSLALSGGSHQVANATELKMAKNADAAASGAGGTSGATLSISDSNYYGSSAVGSTITGSVGTLSSGNIHRSNGTPTLLPASPPPSIPGTNQGTTGIQGASLSGLLTVSGSNIVLSVPNAISVSGLNNPAWNNPPLYTGNLTLNGATTVNTPPAQPTSTASGSGSFNQVSNTSGLVRTGGGTLALSNGTTTPVGNLSGGSLVITPGSTQTGQLTTTTGAVLSTGIAPGNLVVSQSTATTSTSSPPSQTPGSALQIPGSSTSTSPSSSQPFNLIDWMALGGGSALGPGSGSGNLALPDVTSFTTQWDLSSLNSMGIIVVVGPGYTGPGSIPPTSNTTAQP